MSLAPALVAALTLRCAPLVDPTTMVALVRAESGFDPLAIGVNGPGGGRLRSKTPADAIATAKRLSAAGANIDLGLAQINSRNLERLRLSIEAAFDPCRNLAAAAAVLSRGYRLAHPETIGAQPALRIALSLYNTGRSDRGFANGYVARVTGDTPPRSAAPAQPTPAEPLATWLVFARAADSRAFVIHPQALGVLP